MLRIFRVTVLLMGGLLLLMTGLIGQSRESIKTPLYWTVVCCANPSSYGEALYLLEPTSGITQPLTPYLFGLRFLTATNNSFYFMGSKTNDSPSAIYRVQQGNEPELIVQNATTNPSRLSPDGNRLVFTRTNQQGTQWFSVSTKGGLVTPLLSGSNSTTITPSNNEKSPAFSPNGEWLAFEIIDQTNHATDIYRMRVDGSQETNLTDNLETEVYLLGWFYDPIGLVFWSPSEGVLYSSKSDSNDLQRLTLENDNAVTPDIWVIGNWAYAYLAQGSDYRVVQATNHQIIWQATNIMNAWTSPEGTWVFLTRYADDWQVRRGNGSSQRDIYPPNETTQIWAVIWSPDEQNILLYTFDSSSSQNELWLLDVKTATLKRILGEPIYSGPYWSPDGTRILSRTDSNNVPVWRLMYVDDHQSIALNIKNNKGFTEFEAWGPTIDRPFDGNLLAVIGVLIAGVGLIAPRIAPTIIRRRVGPI